MVKLATATPACMVIAWLWAVDAHALTLPDIALNGHLASSYSASQSGSKGNIHSIQNNQLSVGFRTYVWRSWFGLMNGRLAFNKRRGQSSKASTTKGTRLSGAANVNLMHLSRYPFSFAYAKNNSEDGINQNITESFDANQRFTSLDQKLRMSLSYRRTNVSNARDSEAGRNAYSFSFSRTFRRQQLSLSTSLSQRQTNRPDLAGAAELKRATIRHSLSGARNFTVDTHSTVLDSSSRLVEGRSRQTSGTTNAQFSTQASWNPARWDNLALTGGFRAMKGEADLASERLRQGSEFTTMQLRASASYTIGNTSIRASSNVTKTDAAQEEDISRFQTISMNYRPRNNIQSWGDYNYNWGMGSSVSTSSGEQTATTASLNMSQSLSRNYFLPRGFQVNANISQSLNGNRSGQGGFGRGLRHTVNIRANNRDGSMNASLSFRDVRSFSGDIGNSQLMDFMFNKDTKIARDRSWRASLVIQASRTDRAQFESLSVYTSGSFTYNHRNLFKVPSLSFTSSLYFGTNGLTPTEFLSPLDDDFSSSSDDGRSHSGGLSAKLKYKVGLLQVNMAGRLSLRDENTSKSFNINVSRQLF